MGSIRLTDENNVEALKIPNLDVRSFCQDELHLVAYFSRRFSKAAFTGIVIPTVDKRFFNPSVGSRKQTYSRRSRGRSRAEQDYFFSLSSQSRSDIQLNGAKQFQDLTEEILASVSEKLLGSPVRSICNNTSLGKPRNSTVKDLDYRDDESSGRMEVHSEEGLVMATGPSLHHCESEMVFAKKLNDEDLNDNNNNNNSATIMTKLAVNIDTKKIEALPEGEELTMQKSSKAVGQEAEAAGACSDILLAQRPTKKRRIKQGQGEKKRLVSEVARDEGLRREAEGMNHEIVNVASLVSKNKLRRKRSEVAKILVIEKHQHKTTEDLVLQPLLQREETKEVVAPVECGSGFRMPEIPQVDGRLEAQNFKKETSKDIASIHQKEAVMLECLSKMEGMWLSNQTSMKIVDAKGFPKGWKVTIGLSRNNGQVFFEYHDYQSPDGKLWPSFREASQYLLYEVRKLPTFSGVQAVSLIDPDQADEDQIKGGVSDTIAQSVSRLSDSVVLQNLQPSLTQNLKDKKVFGKVEGGGITKPEIRKINSTEDVGLTESPLEGELMEKQAGTQCCSVLVSAPELVSVNKEYSLLDRSTSEQALPVEPQHIVGWNDKGCALCNMPVDPFDLCMCDWCENEFHVGCVEAAPSCGEERSVLCPCCKGG